MRRRIRSAAILTIFLALAAGGLGAAPQEWPPVTEYDLDLKDCPQQPGAPAVFLYREETTDFNKLTKSYFCRLKVLTTAGKERANVEIPFTKGTWRIEDLKARVVRPEGAVVPFSGEVFEKTAVRSGKFRITIKTLALPDVDVGCIIDYRYKMVYDGGGASSEKGQAVVENLLGARGKPREGGEDAEAGLIFLRVDEWDIEEDLFTRTARFVFEPSDDFEQWLSLSSRGMGMRLNWVTRGLGGRNPVMIQGRVELELYDVPAFVPEEQMPPESTQRMNVRIFYLEGTMNTPDKYWQHESKNWQLGLEKFMGKTGDGPAEVRKLTADLTDPAAKLKALYARAQEIRNLSYDRTLTAQRRKELKIKDNHSVADVLKNNYGWRSDITRTFTALAAAAGFEAKVVRVATRDDNFFDKNLCGLYDQFDTELACLKIDGRDQLFDPATPCCPPGIIQWSCTGTTCLAPSDSPPAFKNTPAYPPDKALTQREVALKLDAEGNLAGTVKVTYLGQEALVRRLEHVGDDAVEVRKDLETEMAETLPAGSKATLKTVENMANSADRVVAVFDVSVPGLATSAGPRTLVPVSPLLGSGRHPLQHAQRKYPVYFPYARREFDDIVITLPEGITVETVPAARAIRGESFDYSLVCVSDNGTKIHAQRDLVIKKSYFPVEEYGTAKAFFDKVRAGDEEQVVLTRTRIGPGFAEAVKFFRAMDADQRQSVLLKKQ